MNHDTKILMGIVLVTVLIIGGAIFFLNRDSQPQSTGISQQEMLIPDDAYKIATDSAKVQLVEFADYQCPACSTYHPLVKQLTAEFKHTLTFVYRNYPLPQHRNAKLAAYAAEAAGKQDKFWEMHSLLYDKQQEWAEVPAASDVFTNYAKTLQLNTETFQKDLDNTDIHQKIQRDVEHGNSLGVNSTPTFYLNGQKLEPVANYEAFKAAITDAIEKRPISQAPVQPKVHIHSNVAVILDGSAIDFSQAKYQSNKEKELDSSTHLHDGVGAVVHMHAPNITIGHFFKTLGMSFTKDCFVLDTKEQYCSNESKKLRLYVNGKQQDQMSSYLPQDLDRLLITYGPEDAATLQQQLDSVADTACIYSEKCPERGTPPTEDCVGGLGSDCQL